jgi:hypothetical protein
VLYHPPKGSPSAPFSVGVTGTANIIAEIGEQLAWIGAALHSSEHDGIVSIRPRIHCFRPNFIGIGFNTSSETKASSTHDGNCWHNLFRNLVVVEGFPIPRRSHEALNCGLEIPLNMMAGLARARRVNKFCSRMFLKGYSAMLFPVRCIGDVVVWHLVYDRKGNRISYNDGLAFDIVDIGLSRLERARHILGWCLEMKFYGGNITLVRKYPCTGIDMFVLGNRCCGCPL